MKKDEDDKNRKNKTKREATLESQEHRTEIKVKVPGAEFLGCSLDLIQKILEIRHDVASEPEAVKEKK